MKKLLFTLTLGVCLASSIRSQQFTPQTTTVTTIPPVIWRGTNAQILATQLLSLTNANGTLVIPPGLFTNRSSSISIRVEVGTNGILNTIRARIQ